MLLVTQLQAVIPFLKAAKATGFAGKFPIYMHTATELSTLKALGPDAPEGVLGTANYYYYYPDTPANKAFVKEFKDRYKREPAVGAFYGYLTAHFVEQAYQKAGKIDKEKFIDALEGMTVKSPLGNVTMRAFDHQAVLPMFMGVTKKSADVPYLVASEIVTIPGAEAMPSVDDVKKARAK